MKVEQRPERLSAAPYGKCPTILFSLFNPCQSNNMQTHDEQNAEGCGKRLLGCFLGCIFCIALGAACLIPWTLLVQRSVDQDQTNRDSRSHPEMLFERWGEMGIREETTWGRSNFPNEEYTYIGQSRAYFGLNEVCCEILSHNPDSADQILVGVELRTDDSEELTLRRAVEAIRVIDRNVPEEVINAFLAGTEIQQGKWEVRDESTLGLTEIRLYYRQ